MARAFVFARILMQGSMCVEAFEYSWKGGAFWQKAESKLLGSVQDEQRKLIVSTDFIRHYKMKSVG